MIKPKKDERYYQKPIWHFLDDASKVHFGNKSIFQVINPGKLNPYEGPDIKNICLLENGSIKIGDAEIDVYSSNWFNHNHYANPDFSNVIIHLVFHYDRPTKLNTLIINKGQLNYKYSKSSELISSCQLEEYSLKRLERKAYELGSYQTTNLRFLWKVSINSYLESVLKKRLRPKAHNKINRLYLNPYESNLYEKLVLTLQNKNLEVRKLIKLFRYHCSNLESELFVNCKLPILLFFMPESRLEILTVWWSLESKSKYGFLKNRFPFFSQKYVWQQQGMLEFIRESPESSKIIK